MLEVRRHLLKGGSAAALLMPLIGSGLLAPTAVLAAQWGRNGFTATNIDDALKTHGCANAAESREILITAPEIAENGAKVDIEISSNLPDTTAMAVFADRNPLPLCASLDFAANALPYVRIQLKLAETTRLRAVVKTSDGTHHVAFRDVTVVLGGCGG